MKDIANFEQFNAYCQGIAEALQTTAKAKEYNKYGWSCVSFETDAFGGVYCNFHYDLTTNEVVNWYGTEKAQTINTCRELAQLVKKELAKMLEARDMKAVYDFVNAEY